MLHVDVGPSARTGYDIVALRGELDATNAASTAGILQAAVAPRARGRRRSGGRDLHGLQERTRADVSTGAS
jgi:hypothetical protein